MTYRLVMRLQLFDILSLLATDGDVSCDHGLVVAVIMMTIVLPRI